MEFFDDTKLMAMIKAGVEAHLSLYNGVFGTVGMEPIMNALNVVRKDDEYRVPMAAVENLPITLFARNLHQYVFTGQRDTLGGMLDSNYYLQATVLGFAQVANTAIEYEYDGGYEGDLAKLVDLCAEAGARSMLDFGDEDGGQDLSVRSIALLANMTEEAVRNAISRGEISLNRHPRRNSKRLHNTETQRLEDWLSSRRGYIRRPEGSPPLFDSTVGGIPLFQSKRAFTQFLETRVASEKGKSSGRCVQTMIGHTSIEPVWPYEFDAGAWANEASILDLEPLGLLVQAMKHGLVFGPIVKDGLGYGVFGGFNAIYELMARVDAARRRARDGARNIRVPVSADGSWFKPGDRMVKGYRIGKRTGHGNDRQRYVENYWDALEQLAKMSNPYWTRAHPKTGKTGTIKGLRWDVKDKREFIGLT